MKKQDEALGNFRKAMTKLKAYLAVPAKTEREESGIIQAFEYCFELSWKMLQKKAASEGVAIASPKKAFEFALKANLILPKEEEQWLQMLDDRNLTTHAYDEKIAKDILERIPGHYQSLEVLLLKIKN